MGWADANWRGGQYSRALKRILHKHQGHANKLKLKAGYESDVILIVGDASPDGQAIALAKEGTIAVRYAAAGNMPATIAAVYINSDGATAWEDITT